MKSFIIEGGNKLQGTVEISGSKNSALPIIASVILNSDINKLYNVSNIQDIQIALDLLKSIGCKIEKKNDKIIIDSRKINKTEISEKVMKQMRSTIILAGALLGRFKKVSFFYPGGCDIGARPIDLHIKAFKKMGIKVEETAGFIMCSCDKIEPADINLDFPSVGATENIMMTAVLAEGITTINNAAMEPEIIDLANCLNKMGAKIYGAGSNIIKIVGVSKLKGISYRIIPDRIEAGTMLVATAITGGNATIKNVIPEHILPVISKLEEAECNIEIEKNNVIIQAPKKINSIEIKTMPYPGFPTDLQQIFTAMLTVAKGTSIVVENIFENRFKYISELKRMGAKINIEGRTAIITGKRKLIGTTVEATDLRGGAALIVAGLVAKGTTQINNIEHILRGYENIEQKLAQLGAHIKVINTK